MSVSTAPLRRVRPAGLLLVACCGIGLPAGAVAQGESPAGTTIQWWHGAALVGGVSALMFLDQPVQRLARGGQGGLGDGLASQVRHFGQPEVYGTVTVGLLAAGLMSGDSRLTRSGARLASSLALASGLTYGAKFLAGRARPDDPFRDSDDFTLFTAQDKALPSGHTAMAFAMATSLADDIQRPWATVGLYTLAGAVAWSRVHDNRHWFSDVVAGGVVGIASAKLVSGRWRIFGIRAPSVLSAPGGMGLGWQASF